MSTNNFETMWSNSYEYYANAMDADTAVTKSFTRRMIGSSQKQTIEACQGNISTVKSLLDSIYRWIKGDEDKRLVVFNEMVTEMELKDIYGKLT